MNRYRSLPVAILLALSGGSAALAQGDAVAKSVAFEAGPDAADEPFRIGEAIFHARWKPAPDVSETIDGLGPLYNSDSCAGCHGAAATIRHVLRLTDERYGAQLQDRAVTGHQAEGRLDIREQPETHVTADGRSIELRRLVAHVADPAYGPLEASAPVSLRRVPPLAGMGLVAAVDDAAIRGRADPDDADRDGVSGRLGEAFHPVSGLLVTARFGWKASVATLGQQAAEALHVDMGLATSQIPRPEGDCTFAQTACRAAPHGAGGKAEGAEVSDDEIALLVAYLEGLQPPRASGSGAVTDAGEGRGIYDRVGCGACHVPDMPVNGAAGREAAGTVRLYSDLLLHDMGPRLADGRTEGAATGYEWRTQPLWGLSDRLTEMAAGTSPGLLHDGRARNIEEAILWHGGEADRARRAYEVLPPGERDALLSFLSRL